MKEKCRTNKQTNKQKKTNKNKQKQNRARGTEAIVKG